MEEIVSRDIILSQVDESCSNLCSEIEAQIPLTFNRHDVKEYWSQPHKSPSGNITSADIWYYEPLKSFYENSVILGHAKILTTLAKFIMKRNSGAAEGLTVVTGNHQSFPGRWFRDVEDDEKDAKMDKDVVVDEDVWIGTNVTLLSGVHVGRGAEIGSGSVCRGNIPPYAIVTGNPAKVIGYRFTPEQVLEHEAALYAENDRTDMKKFEKNYNKYFDNRADIAKHLSLY